MGSELPFKGNMMKIDDLMNILNSAKEKGIKDINFIASDGHQNNLNIAFGDTTETVNSRQSRTKNAMTITLNSSRHRDET